MAASAVLYQIIEVEEFGGIIEAFEVVARDPEGATEEDLRAEVLADVVEQLVNDQFPLRYLVELTDKFLAGENSYSLVSGPMKAHFVVRFDVEDPKSDEVIKPLLTEFAPGLLDAIDITNQINGASAPRN